MHDHACTLIWDVHRCMGHNIVPYAYRIAIPYAYRHMGQNIGIVRQEELRDTSFVQIINDAIMLLAFFCLCS